MEAAVRVENLSKTYASAFGRRKVRALDGLTLEVAPGEVFGLLGPNGAGKTTLIKILLGVVLPSHGQARLLGRDAGDPAARRGIGYLPENHRFPDFLTAGQMLDLYARLSGTPEAVRRHRIPLLLDKVGMTDWRDVKMKKFSKGMMQRVGLAQALVNDPDLVFLDEPTDGVDPLGRREIRDLLEWMRDEGKTVFLNSHLLSEVEQVCTRVAILNEGRLVREGTVAELTAVERVYEITCTPLPPPLADELSAHLSALDGPPPDATLRRYRLLATDRTHLNTLLDHLRRAAVEIEAVHPLRRTLEDSFVEVVQDQPVLNNPTPGPS